MAKKGGKKKSARAVKKSPGRKPGRPKKQAKKAAQKTSKKAGRSPRKSSKTTVRNTKKPVRKKSSVPVNMKRRVKKTSRKAATKKISMPPAPEPKAAAMPEEKAHRAVHPMLTESHHQPGPGWLAVLKVLIVLSVIEYSYLAFVSIADYPSISMLYLIAIVYFCVLYVGVANRKEWSWHLGVYFSVIILVASIWLGAGIGTVLTALVLFIIFFQKKHLTE
jgi:hypothetical protein